MTEDQIRLIRAGAATVTLATEWDEISVSQAEKALNEILLVLEETKNKMLKHHGLRS